MLLHRSARNTHTHTHTEAEYGSVRWESRWMREMRKGLEGEKMRGCRVPSGERRGEKMRVEQKRRRGEGRRDQRRGEKEILVWKGKKRESR